MGYEEEHNKVGSDGKILNKQNPYKGALLLTLASVITKLLSALYKVPLQNLTGDRGFYVYQQVYPLYGIAVVFTFSGLPIFISKLLSEQEDNQHKVSQLRAVFTLLVILSVLITGLMFSFSDQIASWMGDPNLAGMIRVVSIFYLFIPIIACMRGYFQSSLQMVPTSLSQVTEQLVRIGIILLAALLYSQGGWSVYQMGELSMSSASLSALVAIIVLAGFLIREDGRLSAIFRFKRPDIQLVKRLATEGTQMILIFSLMLLFQAIDAFTIFNALIDRGLPALDAMALKGVYDRAQPFAQLGLTIALAITSNILPQLTYLFRTKDYKTWRDQAMSSLKLTIILASATTIGLITVLPWLNQALFADTNGSSVIQVYIGSVFFVSVSLCIQAILQSTSVNTYTSYAIVFVLASKAVVNSLMVRSGGIMGSSIVTLAASGLLCLLMVMQLPKVMWRELVKPKFLIKFLLANGGLAIIVSLLRSNFQVSGRLEAFIGAIALAAVGSSLYIIIILRFKLLSQAEIDLLPFSNLLKKVGGYHDTKPSH